MSLKIFAKSVYRKVKKAAVFNPSLPMITPMVPRFSEELGDDVRLNIIVPTLNPEHVFGGISTALLFFECLADTLCVKRRIIVADEDTKQEFLVKYPGYILSDSASNTISERQVIPFSDRATKTIPVGKNDIFVATAWWTAVTATSMLDFIRQKEGNANPMVYFIQDYEPFFYPWSSFSAMAESTYHPNSNVIAVFNSHELKDYFKNHNYSFYKEYFFDPVLNASLKKELVANPPKKKEKKIIVYGRPSVARNCIEIVAESLRKWAVLADDAAEWELISAGEKHPSLTVGEGCVLKSVGKLTIEEYARMMGSCYAGISLMVSPHPSYPPLEMSTFGIKTITNTYENKNLSDFNKNIISLLDMTPENIAKKLHEITESFNENDFEIADNTDYFKNSFSFSDICNSIKEVINI
ncbi:MAG: hypothetical protein E7562_07065 [Ruminococcaceae bacterium]|nr:hypothetical protein [Oscillospiraceae bacterium]